jgi:virginiamycin B lyase
VAQLDPASGKVLKRYNVNTDLHGIGIGSDGKTVWFTGKTKGTVGYLKNGKPVNFQLSNKDAFPIYIAAGAHGNMGFTELQASKIGRVTPQGKIDEFRIPTDDSRPIAIIPDPKAKALWFSEEAGNNVARIDMKGAITEFPVPPAKHNPQPAYILAGLAFDADGNLWTQQYVKQAAGNPPGPDYIIRIGKSVLTAKAGDQLDYTYYEVPTRNTVMHRIIQAPDMDMWYTELKADKIGRISLKTKQSKM